MPIDVVLIEPCFPVNQREFARALHAVGARVTGIGERPKEALDDGLRHWLHHYEQVPNVTSPDAVEAVVRRLSSRVKFDMLEATVEAHVMAAATVRERLGILHADAIAMILPFEKHVKLDGLEVVLVSADTEVFGVIEEVFEDSVGHLDESVRVFLRWFRQLGVTTD